jgi:membrane protease YdiL (CAAX protease family)
MDSVRPAPRWSFLDLVLIYVFIIAFTLLASYFLSTIITSTFVLFVGSALIQFIIMIGTVLVFVLVIKKARLADLGLKGFKGNDILKYGLWGGLVLAVLMLLLGIPLTKLQPEVQPQLFEQMLRDFSQNWQFAVLFLLGVVTAPVSEELFYRGMVYPVLRFHLGPWGGAAVAGLIFGLAHWDLWRAIPLAIGGAALCYIYEKSGSIMVPIIAHGTWNGLMSILVYYNIAGV